MVWEVFKALIILCGISFAFGIMITLIKNIEWEPLLKNVAKVTMKSAGATIIAMGIGILFGIILTIIWIGAGFIDGTY